MLLCRRIAAILVCAVLIAGACFSAAAETGTVQTAFSFSGKDAELTVRGSAYVAKGKEITLTASEAVTWKSSDKKIAKVTKKGVVKGVRKGEVTITATSRANPKKQKEFTITVTGRAVKEIRITAPVTLINLEKRKTVQLEAAASPKTAAQSFTWKSSNKKVASVNSSGEVTALSHGTAVITVTARDGSKVQASIELTVTDPDHEIPEKIRIGQDETEIADEAWCGNLELRDVEIARTVKRIGRRAFAESSVRYLYIPSSVKTIEEDAFEGCRKLVCLTPDDSYAAAWCDAHGIRRYAKDYVSAIIGPEDELTLGNGAKKTVRMSVRPSVSKAKLILESSDEQIFTVDGNKIFGKYPGEADLIVSSPDGSVTARIRVKVLANYRAVLFSESTFDGSEIQRNRGDVRLMKKMLETVTGPDGGKYRITAYDDLTAKEVYEKITSDLVNPSRDGDVSLFFFASHGDYRSTSDKLAGRLWCRNKQTWLELPTLAKALSKARGKVIVLLESCGPGAAIREDRSGKKGEQEDAAEEDAAAFADLAVSAFSEADPGMKAYSAPAEDGSGNKSGGPFRTGKFIVMTAAAYLQVSYMSGPDRYNLFPLWLTRGVGTSGGMAADKQFGNGDGKLTVHELYQYVYKYTRHKQTPKVYPVNSDYVLFLRKE